MENKKTYKGSDLIAFGLKPSSKFSKILMQINSLSFKDEDVPTYLMGFLIEQEKTVFEMPPHENPMSYIENISAENELEAKNLKSVKEAMDSLMRIPTVLFGAVMPDSCPTGKNQIPVGGVVATKNTIHPAFHSADVCCSMSKASFEENTKLDLLMDTAFKTTHFGAGGRKDDMFKLPEYMIDEIKSNPFFNGIGILEAAKTHFGTQGDGNHFLFVGKQRSNGLPTIVTHHGSRGFGAKLYQKGLEAAQKHTQKISPKTDPKNAWLDYETEDGKNYWSALQTVRKWVKLNHEAIHEKIAEVMGIEVVDKFWNEHNFVFKRGDVFYHAKGATPLSEDFVPDSKGGLRLIPLNMASPILIVKGSENENNIGFAPHGAGRNMSRTEHTNNVLIDKTVRQRFDMETKGLDVRFFSGSIDVSELPSAYKNAETIISEIKRFGLGDVVDYVDPYGCIMAGGSGFRKRK